MQFAQGLYVGASGTNHYLFRFDQELQTVSGEIRRAHQVPSSEHNNPTTPPVLEFVTSSRFDVNEDTHRRCDMTETVDELVLTSLGTTVTFTRAPAGTDLVVTLSVTVLGFSESDSATLQRVSPTSFRSFQIDLHRLSTIPAPALTVNINGTSFGVREAFGRAGADVSVQTLPPITVPPGNQNQAWSDDGLLNLLRTDLGAAAGELSWQFRMLVANKHVDGSHVRGVMFDRTTRHAAAIFMDSVNDSGLPGNSAGAPNAAARAIRTIVHETGHGLNLPHCCDAVSPSELRCHAPSFMNLPEEFATGVADYWAQFRWEFDPGELFTLRHGAWGSVIFGGDSIFHDGDAHAEDGAMVTGPVTIKVRDRRRGHERKRRFKAEPIAVFEFGEPIHLEVKRRNTTRKERDLRQSVDPRRGDFSYFIKRPDGKVVRFRPMTRHCAVPESVSLLPGESHSTHDDVFLGYGADGFMFANPGPYEVVAVGRGDRGKVRSEPCRIWVRYPDRATEDAIIPTLEPEVGEFLAIGGGGSLGPIQSLIDELTTRLPNHPLVPALRARVALRLAEHRCKVTRRQGSLRVDWDPPSPDVPMLEQLVGLDPSQGAAPLSNILSGQLTTTLWRVLQAEGDKPKADSIRSTTRSWLEKAGMSAAQFTRFSQSAYGEAG